MANEVRTKWLASLSDGSTAIEGEEPFTDVAGEDSSWHELQAHLREHGLEITALRLQVFKPGEPTRTYNMPSRRVRVNGLHEKFDIGKQRALVPSSYWFGRTVQIEKNMSTGKEREVGRFAMMRAYYSDVALSLFVDEHTGNECWVVPHDNKRTDR